LIICYDTTFKHKIVILVVDRSLWRCDLTLHTRS